MFLQETYGIEDCDYYSTTTYSSGADINKAILNKDACKVEFDLVKGASGSGAYLHVGDNASNKWGIGLVGSGSYGFLLDHNGSRVTGQYSTGLSNGTFHCEFTYDNGSVTCKINNQTKTYSYTQPLSNVLKADCWSSGQIKNIKVKAL